MKTTEMQRKPVPTTCIRNPIPSFLNTNRQQRIARCLKLMCHKREPKQTEELLTLRKIEGMNFLKNAHIML
jgi:hypothetical protein